jgi:hypothetical protein
MKGSFKVIKSESLKHRLMQAFPNMGITPAAERCAERLRNFSGWDGSITGRTIRSYCHGERRPTVEFSQAFAALYGPFEADEWIERKELPRARSAREVDAGTSAERESRRLQMLINRFCQWCTDGDEKPTCKDALCSLRPASPLALDRKAITTNVASRERWE